jgi:hypothetical protein
VAHGLISGAGLAASFRRVLAIVAVMGAFVSHPCLASETPRARPQVAEFPQDLQRYDDAGQSLTARLRGRIASSPFNLVGTAIFFLAILHTFLSGRLREISHRLERAHARKIERGAAPLRSVSHSARLFHFLGEIEVVFGLWAIPLVLSVAYFFGWSTVVGYVSHTVNYTEAMFVLVIMTLASTRPTLKLSEAAMDRIARLFGGSLTAWWLTILTLGPLLGSFITEPAAMTICALLLVRKFYELEPTPGLKYATLGLLFVNISVGGTLTHFAAPPVLMVAAPWDWGTGHMLLHFGGKAAAGIAISSLVYWFVFRREFDALGDRFARRTLKEEILTTHLPRERVERATDEAIAQVETEVGAVRSEVAALVERITPAVKQRVREHVLEQITELGLNREVALEAFEQRFEEIKFHHLQRELPHLLPGNRRAPFQDPRWNEREEPVPAWITLIHVAFMGWTIANAQHPALFIAGLLFFLGFATVTADYQNTVDLKSPLLVGFFLGGLVTHGGVQGWWIEPVLGSLGEMPLLAAATALTAFNDNAAITYLSTLVPGFTEGLKYAVVAGAVSGGGLTVIANAPNPAGQAILTGSFENGIRPAGLFKAAVVPTVIMFGMFALFR